MPSSESYTPSREEQEAFPYLTTEQVEWGLDEFFRKIKQLHKRKSSDYATTPQDGLSNFRETSKRLGIPLPKVFLGLMEKHLIALENDARRTERPLNEGVDDRLLDLACYAGLFYLALREEDLKKRKATWGFR